MNRFQTYLYFGLSRYYEYNCFQYYVIMRGIKRISDPNIIVKAKGETVCFSNPQFFNELQHFYSQPLIEIERCGFRGSSLDLGFHIYFSQKLIDSYIVYEWLLSNQHLIGMQNIKSILGRKYMMRIRILVRMLALFKEFPGIFAFFLWYSIVLAPFLENSSFQDLFLGFSGILAFFLGFSSILAHFFFEFSSVFALENKNT